LILTAQPDTNTEGRRSQAKSLLSRYYSHPTIAYPSTRLTVVPVAQARVPRTEPVETPETLLPARNQPSERFSPQPRQSERRASLRPIHIADFFAKTIVEPDWRIDDVLPTSGFALLAGPEKSGKSLLSGQEALCLAAGIDFLGQKTRQSNVLLIEEEGSEKSLQQRLHRQAAALGIDFPGKVRLTVLHQPRLRLESSEGQRILRELVENAPPDVIIVGPLSQVFGMEDENSAAEMNHATRYMLDLTAGRNVVVQLAHHLRKDASLGRDASSFFKSVRGSNALMGAVDAAIGIGRQPTSPTGKIVLLLRNGEHDPIPVRFNRESLLFDVSGSDHLPTLPSQARVEHGKDNICLRILNMLRSDGDGQTRNMVKDALALGSANTAQEHLKGLVALNLARTDRRGNADYYWLVQPVAC
jgi:hypothetical protein